MILLGLSPKADICLTHLKAHPPPSLEVFASFPDQTFLRAKLLLHVDMTFLCGYIWKIYIYGTYTPLVEVIQATVTLVKLDKD